MVNHHEIAIPSTKPRPGQQLCPPGARNTGCPVSWTMMDHDRPWSVKTMVKPRFFDVNNEQTMEKNKVSWGKNHDQVKQSPWFKIFRGVFSFRLLLNHQPHPPWIRKQNNGDYGHWPRFLVVTSCHCLHCLSTTKTRTHMLINYDHLQPLKQHVFNPPVRFVCQQAVVLRVLLLLINYQDHLGSFQATIWPTEFIGSRSFCGTWTGNCWDDHATARLFSNDQSKSVSVSSSDKWSIWRSAQHAKLVCNSWA